jgi:hypothetical protein
MSPRQEIVESLKAIANETGCKLTAAPQPTQKWLADHSRLPVELVDILCHSWPDRALGIGNYDLYTLEDLSESDRSKIAFKGGYFVIGAAGNGDLLVVKRCSKCIEDCEIGLISHEELWENEENLDQIYEPVCRGFQNLLINAQIEGRLPMDFYEARNRRVK